MYMNSHAHEMKWFSGLVCLSKQQLYELWKGNLSGGKIIFAKMIKHLERWLSKKELQTFLVKIFID